jgi:hypothetical protein
MRNFSVFFDETCCNLIFSRNISYFLGMSHVISSANIQWCTGCDGVNTVLYPFDNMGRKMARFYFVDMGNTQNGRGQGGGIGSSCFFRLSREPRIAS